MLVGITTKNQPRFGEFIVNVLVALGLAVSFLTMTASIRQILNDYTSCTSNKTPGELTTAFRPLLDWKPSDYLRTCEQRERGAFPLPGCGVPARRQCGVRLANPRRLPDRRLEAATFGKFRGATLITWMVCCDDWGRQEHDARRSLASCNKRVAAPAIS